MKLGDRDKLLDLLAEFFDALTGSTFGENVRAADLPRARLVYVTASDIVAHLRAISPTQSVYLFISIVVLVIAGFVLFH